MIIADRKINFLQALLQKQDIIAVSLIVFNTDNKSIIPFIIFLQFLV